MLALAGKHNLEDWSGSKVVAIPTAITWIYLLSWSYIPCMSLTTFVLFFCVGQCSMDSVYDVRTVTVGGNDGFPFPSRVSLF